MPKQNYQNHTRSIPLWHYITSTLIGVLIAGSIINLVRSTRQNIFSASLMVLVSFVLASIFWYCRWFALRAQDRAIRAEENLRHFVLTGKLLDKHLRTSQIIALRFASDDELADLAQLAAEKKMRSIDIKKSIIKWRADNHRV